jgi:hypothetical protein
MLKRLLVLLLLVVVIPPLNAQEETTPEPDPDAMLQEQLLTALAEIPEYTSYRSQQTTLDSQFIALDVPALELTDQVTTILSTVADTRVNLTGDIYGDGTITLRNQTTTRNETVDYTLDIDVRLVDETLYLLGEVVDGNADSGAPDLPGEWEVIDDLSAYPNFVLNSFAGAFGDGQTQDIFAELDVIIDAAEAIQTGTITINDADYATIDVTFGAEIAANFFASEGGALNNTGLQQALVDALRDAETPLLTLRVILNDDDAVIGRAVIGRIDATLPASAANPDFTDGTLTLELIFERQELLTEIGEPIEPVVPPVDS